MSLTPNLLTKDEWYLCDEAVKQNKQKKVWF